MIGARGHWFLGLWMAAEMVDSWMEHWLLVLWIAGSGDWMEHWCPVCLIAGIWFRGLMEWWLCGFMDCL